MLAIDEAVLPGLMEVDLAVKKVEECLKNADGK